MRLSAGPIKFLHALGERLNFILVLHLSHLMTMSHIVGRIFPLISDLLTLRYKKKSLNNVLSNSYFTIKVDTIFSVSQLITVLIDRRNNKLRSRL